MSLLFAKNTCSNILTVSFSFYYISFVSKWIKILWTALRAERKKFLHLLNPFFILSLIIAFWKPLSQGLSVFRIELKCLPEGSSHILWKYIFSIPVDARYQHRWNTLYGFSVAYKHSFLKWNTKQLALFIGCNFIERAFSVPSAQFFFCTSQSKIVGHECCNRIAAFPWEHINTLIFILSFWCFHSLKT